MIPDIDIWRCATLKSVVRSSLAIVFAFILCCPAAAKEPALLYGYGTASCAEYADAYRQDPVYIQEAFYGWAQGYMSGWNVALTRNGEPLTDLGSIPPKAQAAHLRAFCDAHPLLAYYQAVEDLMSAMRAGQGLPPLRAAAGQ